MENVDVRAYLTRLSVQSKHGARSARYVLEYNDWNAKRFIFQDQPPSLAGFDQARLNIWLDELEKSGLSPASLNRRLSAVLSVWRWAHRRGFPVAPPEGLYRRERGGRRRVLTPAEESRLFEALGEPYRSLAAFLGLTGLRVSEALALKWADVQFPSEPAVTARVHVRDSKNGDARIVPVRGELLRLAIVGRRAPKDTDLTGPFSDVSQSAFNHAWAAARAALGLKDDAEFVPHALRHTYATRLVVAGVPLSVVAKLLGHRTVRTTMRYSHVADADAERWIERVS